MAATRRRGAALVSDIQAAVLAEVAERGYAATTYERVADRAGTSKPVLYRRWPTKTQLVLDALAAAHPDIAVPSDTGSLDGDIRALLLAFRSSVESFGRRTVLALLAEAGSEGDRTVRDLFLVKGSELMQPLVDRARQRGELGDRPIPTALVRLPFDLARHELFIDGALPDDALDAIVHEISLPLFISRSRA